MRLFTLVLFIVVFSEKTSSILILLILLVDFVVLKISAFYNFEPKKTML